MRVDLSFKELDLGVFIFFQNIDEIDDKPKKGTEHNWLTAVMQVINQIPDKSRINIIDFIK